MDKSYIRTLSDHFDPPEGYTGCFGWIVGYSADAHFLNEATERFLGQTKGQRRYMGQIRLGVMLDPGNPQIPPGSVPGALHLLYDQREIVPFRLLHAKVAVLGYQCEKRPEDWRVRLIVSTGNWTRQTMEESLDLAWVVEASPSTLAKPTDKQVCADLAAAWNLIDFLRERFDTSVLKTRFTAPPVAVLDDWMAALKLHASEFPRFFDNRTQPLLSQLPDMVRTHAGKRRRNYLGLGSGFYEGGTAKTLPTVPSQIVQALQKEGLLKAQPDVSLTVNPNACQAITFSSAEIKKRGWKINGPWVPKIFGPNPRDLHAKFIFSASWQDDLDECISPWIYLGSANLTPAGFLNRMSSRGGNLEAGVVLAPDELTWGRNTVEYKGRDSLLPLQWDKEVKPEELKAGDPMPDRPDPTFAPPVAWLRWEPLEQGGGRLLPPESTPDVAFNVLRINSNSEICVYDGCAFIWPDPEPAEVCVAWGKHSRAVIPILNEIGQLVRGAVPMLDIDEAIQQLLSFPQPPDVETSAEEDGELAVAISGGAQQGGAGLPARSSIRRMMQLIERIAERQTKLSSVQWNAWLLQLEATLHQMAGDPVLTEFRSLGLNPLGPLFHPPFRPEFAEDTTNEDGRGYEAVLGRVAGKWGFEGLPGLGEMT